jgi:hypothetical protein
MNNLSILDSFRNHVRTFTSHIGYAYNDMSCSEIIGVNLKASSAIRKPSAIERCENVIKALDLPLQIRDSDHNFFQVVVNH